MKVGTYRIFTISLMVLALTVSADCAFAQKQLKNVQRVIKGGIKLPKGVNPKTVSAAGAHATVPVVRPVSPPALERAITTQVTVQTAANSTVPLPHELPPTNILLPDATAALPNGLRPSDFFTGQQALNNLMPRWRAEMKFYFPEEQIEILEKTFKDTDAILFQLDEDGNWLAPVEGSTSWDYENWYALQLKENLGSISDGQFKLLFGKFSRFDDVFTRLHLQAFLLVNKRTPKLSAPGEEGRLARHVKYNMNKRHSKFNPEVEEYVYGNLPAYLRPGTKILGRTPEQVLAQVKNFIEIYKRLPSMGGSKEELSLRNAFNYACNRAKNLTDDTSRQLLRIKEQWSKEYTARKTPQQVLEEIEEFIAKNQRLPSRSAKDEAERSLRTAFGKACHKVETQNLTDETSLRLLELKEQWVQEHVAKRTPQQILEETEEFIAKNQRFPSGSAEDEAERSLRTAFGNACYKVEAQNLTDETSLRLLGLKEQWIQNITRRSPQQVIALIEEFTARNQRFPSLAAEDEAEYLLRRAFDRACYKVETQNLTDETSLRLLGLKKQWIQEYVAKRTPQQILEEIEEFIAKNQRFPSLSTGDEAERSLRIGFRWACTKAETQHLTDETSLRLLELKEQWIQEYVAKRTPQQILKETEEFIAKNQRFPSLLAEDEAELSLRTGFRWACIKAETQHLTDETSLKLLELKEQWVQNVTRRSPQQVLALIEEFIARNQRFPALLAEDEAEHLLRRAFDKACHKVAIQHLTDETSLKLLNLKEQWVRSHK